MLVLIALLAGCRAQREKPARPAQAETPTDVMGKILGAQVAWGDAHNRGDSTALAALYDPQATLIPHGAPPIKGRDAIRHYWATIFAARTDTVLRSAAGTDQLDIAGDIAVETGSVTFTLRPRAGGAERQDVMHYLVAWKKTGAYWALYRQMMQ